ncbi:MAG: hypothetical protein P8X42_03745 [Calditrichaceae bacterium]
MRKINFTSLLLIPILILWHCRPQQGNLFKNSGDIGKCNLAGSVKYNPEKNLYVISGSGYNMWYTTDAFHFTWSEVSGDLKLSAKIEWMGEGQQHHRKAGLIVRQSLEPDAAYIDAVIHGDGLISMQYRNEKGDSTYQIVSPDSGLSYLQLERVDDNFIFYVSGDGADFKKVGKYELDLPDPVYAGLGVCSHDSTTIETAVFSEVQFIH